MLCKYTEVLIFFLPFYDLSLLHIRPCSITRDIEMLSDSASLNNLLVPWAPDLELCPETRLALEHQQKWPHRGPRLWHFPRMVCSAQQLEILFVSCFQTLLCLSPPSVPQPRVALLNLVCGGRASWLSRVLGREKEIFGPKLQCLSLCQTLVDPEDLESGHRFIFLVYLFLHKRDGRKNIP